MFLYGGFTLSYKYELYYPNTMNNSPCGDFPSTCTSPNILNFASNGISNKLQFDLLHTNCSHTHNVIIITITLPQLNIPHIHFWLKIESWWLLLAGWLLAGWLTVRLKMLTSQAINIHWSSYQHNLYFKD